MTQQAGQDILVFHAWDAGHTRRQLHAAPLDWPAGRPHVRLSAASELEN